MYAFKRRKLLFKRFKEMFVDRIYYMKSGKVYIFCGCIVTISVQHFGIRIVSLLQKSKHMSRRCRMQRLRN